MVRLNQLRKLRRPGLRGCIKPGVECGTGGENDGLPFVQPGEFAICRGRDDGERPEEVSFTCNAELLVLWGEMFEGCAHLLRQRNHTVQPLA